MLSYVNRKLVTYYLHERTARGGRTVYVMTRSSDGALEQLPPGMEIVENVNAQVSIRIRRPRNITAEEEALVRKALTKLNLNDYRLEIKDREIIVCEPRCHNEAAIDAMHNCFHSDPIIAMAWQKAREVVGDQRVDEYLQQQREEALAALNRDQDYEPVLKLTLSRQPGRCFTMERMKYTGEGGWRFVNVVTLEEAVCKYLPTLGKESFFEM
jgi:uncharacterized protein (DUF1778 family)